MLDDFDDDDDASDVVVVVVVNADDDDGVLDDNAVGAGEKMPNIPSDVLRAVLSLAVTVGIRVTGAEAVSVRIKRVTPTIVLLGSTLPLVSNAFSASC